ncbi:unnamed protein product [Ectocarpus sp. 8 AP-2014]
MGSAWSRKQATIHSSFQAAPLAVASWDLQHVKILHDRFRDDGYEFGIDRVSLRDLISSALPLARGVTGDLWEIYVEHEQEMLYPLELFAAVALQCHGLSRCGASTSYSCPVFLCKNPSYFHVHFGPCRPEDRRLDWCISSKASPGIRVHF